MAAMRTFLVVFILFASAFFIMPQNSLVFDVEAHATPNIGVTWNLTDLANIPNGPVWKINSTAYFFIRSVTISAKDTLIINESFNQNTQVTIFFQPSASLYVDGTLNITGTPFWPVSIEKAPPPELWGGIHFNSTSKGMISFTNISGAYTGLYINGSSPEIMYSNIYHNSYGVSINDNAKPVFTQTRVNESNIHGIVSENSTLTLLNECNITANAQNGIVLKNSHAVIDNCDIDYNSRNGIHIIDSVNVVVHNNSDITRNGVSDLEDVAGIYSQNSEFYVNDTIFYKNKQSGINITDGSHAYLLNITLWKSSVNGIYLNESRADINRLNVTKSRTGIFVDTNGTLDLFNYDSYLNSQYGIHIKDSKDVSVTNSTIIVSTIGQDNFGFSGIHANQSTGINLLNVTIIDASKFGIHLYNSSMNGTDVTIRYSGVHALMIDSSKDIYFTNLDCQLAFQEETIYTVYSDNVNILDGSIIRTNTDFCIALRNTTLNLENVTFDYGTGNILDLHLGSHVTALNTTMEDDRVYFELNDTSDVTRYWYINVNVTTEGGSPIPLATVNISDAWNNTLYSRKAGFLGKLLGNVHWLKVYGSLQNSSGIFFNNTYTISVNFTAKKTNTTVVNSNKHIWIELWLYPNLSPGNVTNITPVQTHDNTPDITWNKTTDPDGDTVFYRIKINDGTTDIYDNITGNNYFNVTTPLLNQRYYLNISAFDSSGSQGNYTEQTLDIVNNKPTSPVIAINPTTPNTSDGLVLKFLTPSQDLDSINIKEEEIRYTVKWFKDGVEQTGLEKKNKTLKDLNNTELVPSGLTSIGQTWRAKVTPYDGHSLDWNLTGNSGAHSNGTPVSVFVTIGNRKPVLSNPINDFSILEDGSDSTTVNLKTVFSDPDSGDPVETMTFSATGWTQITVSIIQSTGAVTFTPAPNWFGQETINFTATDFSNAKAYDEVVVTVTSVNDPPVFDAFPDKVAWEDSKFILYLHGNDSADGDTLNFTTNIITAIPGLLNSPALKRYDDTFGRRYEIIPDNSMVGNYTINVTIDDQTGLAKGIAYFDFKLRIVNTNDAPGTPVITSPADKSIFKKDSSITFEGTCSDDDTIWNDILTFIWESSIDGHLGIGPSLNTNQLSAGVHTITLKVTDSAVVVSTSIEVTIEVEVIDVVATAFLTSPENKTKIDQTQVTLKWGSNHVNASEFTYNIYLNHTSVVPRNSEPIKSGHDKTSLVVTNLVDKKTYYWQVVPFYRGIEGNPSGIFQFTVDLIYIPPKTCVLVSPVNDSTITTTSTKLVWDSTHGDKDRFKYDVYWGKTRFDVNNLPTPNEPLFTGTELTITGLEDKTRYYWTVVPDLDGEKGVCINDDPIWTFYVDTAGGKTDVTVDLVSPADENTITTGTVSLEWKSDDASASSYTYKLFISEKTDPTVDPPVKTGLTKTKTDFTVTDGKTYYWKVIPVYQGSDGVCLSGVWSFKVDFGYEPKENITISGEKDISVETGGSNSVTLKVTNTGDIDLDLDVVVSGISGAVADPDSITVPTGQEKDVTVTITIPEDTAEGTHTVKVEFKKDDGTSMGSKEFTVTITKKPGSGQTTTPPEEKGGNTTVLALAVVVILIVVIVLALSMMKRKKGGKKEEEGGEDERKDQDLPQQATPPAGGVTAPGAVPPPAVPPSSSPAPAAPPTPAPQVPPETPATGPETSSNPQPAPEQPQPVQPQPVQPQPEQPQPVQPQPEQTQP